MKFLHVGDMHLGKTLDGYSLIEEQKYVLDQILNMEFDSIVMAGDIYDRSVPSSEAINLFDDFINELINRKKNILLISGNHDSKDRLGFLNRILVKNNLFIETELHKKLEPISIDGVNFYLIPFKTLYEFRQFYEMDFKDTNEAYKYILDNRVIKDGYNVLVLHDYITAGESIFSSASERPISIGGSSNIDASILDGFDYVALGHIHGPQKVGKENIRYAGSIYKYSFSEINHKKSVVLVDTDTNQFDVIPLKFKNDLVIINGSMDEVTNPDFYKNYRIDDDYFSINLSESYVYDAQIRLKVIYKKLMEISVARNENKDEIIEDNIVSESLFTSFENFIKNICNDDIENFDTEEVYELLKEVQNED